VNNEKHLAQSNTELFGIERAEYFELFRRGRARAGPAAVDENSKLDGEVNVEMLFNASLALKWMQPVPWR
jgi:hypothetical protein